MTRALVTGSTGFVGSNLAAALLEQGIDVIGLRRTTSPYDAVQGLNIPFVTGNLLDPQSLGQAMKGIDWVFHVAAVANYWEVPHQTIYRINVDGTRNVLQAALEANIKKVVYTSSVAALSDLPAPPRTLITEEDTFNQNPNDFPYGHSKHLAEKIVAEYVERGLPVITVLPAAVIGPRDLKFNAGELILQALKPTLPFIPTPRGGLNYIDVRDCVQAHLAAAQSIQVGRRYILAGHNLTHHETIHIVNEVLGTSLGILTIPRWTLKPAADLVEFLTNKGVQIPIDRSRVLLSGRTLYYDNTRAINDLGLTIRPFAESVYDTYRWYLESGYLEKRGVELTQ